MRMALSEVFRSFQGEGPHAGRPAIFVRTHGCSKRCVWCDTPYTLKPDPDARGGVALEDLIAELEQFSSPHYIIWTGGEPLLQWEKIREVVQALPDWEHACESHGDHPDLDLTDVMSHLTLAVVSPKREEAGETSPEDLERRWIQAALTANRNTRTLCLKYVVTSAASLEEKAQRLLDLDLPLPVVSFQPEYGTMGWEDLWRAVTDDPGDAWMRLNEVAEVRITPQMHKLVWGPVKRGV